MGRHASAQREDDLVPRHTIGKHELPRETGRRRAESEISPENELIDSGNPANPGPLHRKGAHRGKANRRPAIGTALGVATTGAIMIAANATTAQQPTVVVGQQVFNEEEPITAESTVIVTQPRVEVTTEAAPPEPATELIPVVTPKVEYTPPPEPPPTPVVVVPPPPVQPPVSAGDARRAAVLNAAYAQIGVYQDCTMLVTNSLRAIGINYHDWPIGYFNLGYQVSRLDALPGDLVYYANGGGGWAHIAVYAGNGRAVHGGFNGNETREFSVDVGSGPVFIRLA